MRRKRGPSKGPRSRYWEGDKGTYFRDRAEAGEQLAEKFLSLYRREIVILAIPRGGVEVGFSLAIKWQAPLDVVIPRKIGSPQDYELAIGAVTEEGEPILDEELISRLKVSEQYLKEACRKEREEIARRLSLYRGGLPPLEIKGREVILTDDGVATGATMRAAVLSLRRKEPKAIIILVPVAAQEAVSILEPLADEFHALYLPPSFWAVGQFYQDFSQTSDQTVSDMLKKARQSWLKERMENA